MTQNALGVIEFVSIARGVEALDLMLKSAKVNLYVATPLCPGKFTVVIGGDVAEVETSLNSALAFGEDNVIDKMIIANLHPSVFPALNATTEFEIGEAIGIIETWSISSAILAADAAAKSANVQLIEIRVARGLGGKSFVTLTGKVSAVTSAVEAGAAQAAKEGILVGTSVIASPHPDIWGVLR
ncbi:BMC domain-containing protein [bacterium]|nr:BMC domain-containing protein [bacterium]